MADQEGENFLRLNGLDQYVESFKAEQLRMEHFSYFLNGGAELRELIPFMKDRATFVMALERRGKQTHDVGIQVQLDVPATSCRSNLFEICEQSDLGREFLEHYRVNNDYESRFRINIKKAVVGYFFKITRGKITEVVFEEMRDLITTALPLESGNTWYQHPFKNVKPKGLLYYEYRCLQKKDHDSKKDQRVTREERMTKGSRQISLEKAANPAVLEVDDDELDRMQYAKLCLKSTAVDLENEIMAHWVNCFKLRRREALEGTLKLEDYEVLQQVNNFTELIDYDFRQIHPDCAGLNGRLAGFMTKFRQVARENRKTIDEDRALRAELNELFFTNFVADDRSTLLALLVLSIILRPKFILQGNGNKRTRPSTSSIRESFITVIQEEPKLQETIASRRLAAAEKNQTPPLPFMVAIGSYTEVSSYYVIFDHLQWELKSVTATLDLFFKLHSVFHLEYDERISMLMKFFQMYFYEIRHEGQIVEAAVEMLISDCKRY